MPPMSIMSRISRVFLLGSTVAALGLGQAWAEQALPNILWITSEDNGASWLLRRYVRRHAEP